MPEVRGLPAGLRKRKSVSKTHMKPRGSGILGHPKGMQKLSKKPLNEGK